MSSCLPENSLVPAQHKEVTITLDFITKIFINSQVVLGLNRVRLIDDYSKKKKILISLLSIYVINCFCLLIQIRNFLGVWIVRSVFITCIILSFTKCKTLRQFFVAINEFDKEAGCTPRTSYIIRKNAILYVLIVMVIICLCLVIFAYGKQDGLFHAMCDLPFRLILATEFIFYGHLLGLLYTRIQLIIHFIQMSQSGNQRKQYKQIRFGFKYTVTEGRENCIPNTELLMDLYEKLITANEHLTDAIKWQFTLLISLSMGHNIYVTYTFISDMLNKDDPDRLSTQYWDHMSSMCYALGSVLALACPCACADRLQRRVNDLRMMLATRIYEDKLDERSRVSARALLALTGAHGLGVSLLGMLRVDISLPLHYVSLLVTYLIILLQFEKVNSKV